MISGQAQPELPEASQIRLVLDGNAEAFCELVRPHQHFLYLKALSIVHSEADAEEVVQNAVLKVFKKLYQFRQESQFRTWLMSITINEARMWLRRHRKFNHETLDDENDSGRQHIGEVADSREGPFEVLERRQVRGAILKALNLLPSPVSQVFILRDLQQLSISETARTLGISESCVKTRLRRGRGRMRHALAQVCAIRTLEPSHRSTSSDRGWRHSVPVIAPGEQITESVLEGIL
jgi:RNA polymerase sigma-70 factor (ECF subfamily)